MDRTLWGDILYPLPGWLCPICQRGHLRLDKATYHALETKTSRDSRDQFDWEADWIEQKFVGLLRCDNSQCAEAASVSGTTLVDEVYEVIDGFERPARVDKFRVSSISPGPLPFVLSAAVPTEVSALLRRAAELYWTDTEASANKLRQATEALLTDRGEKRFTTNKNGKRVSINLHDRIVSFSSMNSHVGALLLAVKWLGNSGSHVGGLERKDVLDAFDILEQVIDEIYGKTRARVTALAKKITKKKGPI